MQSDPKRNRFLAIYLTSLALVGIGLIAAGAVLGLGGWTYGLGGLLLVAGGGGGITMLATGGAGKVSCPRCVFENEVLHLSVARTIECGGCGEWLEGAREMTVVSPDHVAKHPTFTCPLPAEPLQWVHREGVPLCPTSGSPSLNTKTIEGRSALGSFAAVVAPVSVVRVVKLDVPVCPKHDDGVALSLGETKALAFRSLHYMRLFRKLNPV